MMLSVGLDYKLYAKFQLPDAQEYWNVQMGPSGIQSLKRVFHALMGPIRMGMLVILWDQQNAPIALEKRGLGSRHSAPVVSAAPLEAIVVLLVNQECIHQAIHV